MNFLFIILLLFFMPEITIETFAWGKWICYKGKDYKSLTHSQIFRFKTLDDFLISGEIISELQREDDDFDDQLYRVKLSTGEIVLGWQYPYGKVAKLNQKVVMIKEYYINDKDKLEITYYLWDY